MDDPFNVVHDKTSELRRQVDMSREQLKLAIDEHADKLITRIDKYEREQKNFIDSDEFQVKLSMAENKLRTSKGDREKWMTELNRLKVDIKSYAVIKEKCDKQIKKMSDELNSLKSLITPINTDLQYQVTQFFLVDIPFSYAMNY